MTKYRIAKLNGIAETIGDINKDVLMGMYKTHATIQKLAKYEKVDSFEEWLESDTVGWLIDDLISKLESEGVTEYGEERNHIWSKLQEKFGV